MSTRQLIARAMSGFGAALLLTVALHAGQQGGTARPGHDMTMRSTMKPHSMKMTKAQKIANAMTAAPSAISAGTTVLDWPATEGAAPEVLRAGGNGWSCFPDMPESKGNDPMCLDETWMKWADAYFAHKTPDVTRVGIGYMIGAGGAWGSNSDPFAMHETPDNHWGHHDPHVMILVPDPASLAGLPTDHSRGGPYVMWAGTPYAHIMAPIASTASTNTRH
jgi:hypothetical protein